MIAFICLLAVFGLGNCLEQLPTRHEIESSINRTIEEVERMVKADPSLPRLSRSQIVDILFNITSKDMDTYTDYVEKTREQYQRALMVVLPYNSKDSKDENLTDLYTKSPMVQVLPDSSEPVNTKNEDPTSVKTVDNLIDTKTKKSESESANQWKNHRHTYAEVSMVPPTEEAIRKLLNSDKARNPAPERFSFNLDNFDTSKEKEITAKSTSENFWKPAGTPPSKSSLEIVYSTSVTQSPTTKVAHTTKIDFEDFRPTMPPMRSTQNVLTSDQWHYNAPPPTTTMKSHRKSPANTKNQIKSTNVPFLPTMMTEDDGSVADLFPTRNPQVATSTKVVVHRKNEESKWNMENLRVMNENDKTSPVYVTPMSSTTSAKLGGFIDAGSTPEATKKPMHMREEVKDLLASIGLRPKKEKINDNTKNKATDDEDQIFGTNFRIPDSKNVQLGQASGLSAVGVASPSISSQNTFENTPQDVKKGVNNLSPDVQLLFQRFGLQSSAKDRENQQTTTTTQKPIPVTQKTSFWNSFKPLPASEVKDEGMKDFLAKFGLGLPENRNEKAMKTKKNVEDRPPSLIEAVPANMKKILENIGLITSSHNSDVSSNHDTRLETTETPELHVFKPHETSFDDAKQRTKINDLLDTVKKVQEGKADVVAVQKAAKELLETTKTLKNGPDPLSLEEILKIYNDDVKNEIKRQQNPKELADMAASETSEASTTTTTSTSTSSDDSLDVPSTSLDSSAASSDSAASSAGSSDLSTDLKISDVTIETTTTTTTETSNLDALADSFGGSTSAPDPVLPTRRKTGLYFLVDWNTFLEVGEEETDKVNLRFQPKAGDRTRFIPVTVP